MIEATFIEVFQTYGLTGLLFGALFLQNWRVFDQNKTLQKELFKVIVNNTRALERMELIIKGKVHPSASSASSEDSPERPGR